MSEYWDWLNERVTSGEITEVTRDTYYGDAQRVIEAVVRELTAETMCAHTSNWFRGDAYGQACRSLKSFVNSQRDRLPVNAGDTRPLPDPSNEARD